MLADLQLARRIERAEGHANARFVEARARNEPSLGAAWVEIAGAYAMFDGVSSPVTQAFGLGLFQQASDAHLGRIEQFFFDRGAACHLEISPLAGLELTRRLVERGYLPEEQSNVLFQPLPRDASRQTTDISVRISRPEESELWARVALEGWGDSPPEILDYVREMGPVIAAREDGINFLAELDGRPAACGSLCLHEGVATLAGACTIPDARRRGAQRAVLDARLSYAADHGCDVAAIVTEPGSGSQRNAERQGFRVAYSRTKWFLEQRNL